MGTNETENVTQFDKDTSILQKMGIIIIFVMWIGGQGGKQVKE